MLDFYLESTTMRNTFQDKNSRSVTSPQFVKAKTDDNLSRPQRKLTGGTNVTSKNSDQQTWTRLMSPVSTGHVQVLLCLDRRPANHMYL